MTYLLTYYTPDGAFCQSIESLASLTRKIDAMDGLHDTEVRVYEIRQREVIQRGWVYNRKIRTLWLLDRYLNTVDMYTKED